MAESYMIEIAEIPALIAIDPGRNSGVASFRGGCLAWCGCFNVERDDPFDHVEHKRLIIEIPLYSGQTAGKDPQALIALAVCAGRWIERVQAVRVTEVYPSQWKGNVPKETHNARVLDKLAADERALVPSLPPSKLHNVIDAIGLGLFALGRMGRGK